MTIEIMRRYELQAAHWLPRVPDEHKCGALHGHTWQIEIWVAGTPDERGWFMDFADIDDAYEEWVHDQLDHSCLNDSIENPTTENLCVWIAARLGPALPGLCRIVARENDHSCVCMRVEPEPSATSTNSSAAGGGS
jgi:6-pyruvoyltetrahydropterin/6-carboxytetrahydropterin synthase